MSEYRPKLIGPPNPNRDELEKHTSMANRINIPYESPWRSMLHARDNMEKDKDALRMQKPTRGVPAVGRGSKAAMQMWERQATDHQIVHDFRHHYTDYRNGRTYKKGNLLWPVRND